MTWPVNDTHTYESTCPGWQHWCRIHRYPRWSGGELSHERYPDTFNILSSSFGWLNVIVYCGPGAFYPSRKTAGLPPREDNPK